MIFVFINLLLVYQSVFIVVETTVIKFGGIFEEKDIVQRIAFAYAVDSLNEKIHMVPAVKFVPMVFTVPIADSYKVFQKGKHFVRKCRQLHNH